MPDTDNLVWISQTTLSVDETMDTVHRLRERFPHLQDPPSDDICYATQNRQVAIKKVAPDADLVIVVGSANSSNSVRLVEVALEYGAKAAHRVDYASEIQQEWLEGVALGRGDQRARRFPRCWSQEVLADLADAGYGDGRGGDDRARGSDVLAAERTAHRRFGQRRRSRARRTRARLAFPVATSRRQGGAMRVRVLPRDLAGRIINGTVATMGWAVGALTIVATIPVLIETLMMRGRARRSARCRSRCCSSSCWASPPSPAGGAPRSCSIYLAVGAVATLGYELVLLQGDPGILDEANLFLREPPDARPGRRRGDGRDGR